ncbi:MAG: DNA adenine methylase [Treponema sp.]|nr:DNA adenine methylase [Treponema sp.]
MASGYNSPIKPYLKWAGGKRQLLPRIKKYLPADINSYTYYEPFVGAGAVFFAVLPSKAVINDLNAQLILTYRAIRDNVEGLIGLLNEHKSRNTREYYYAVRNLDRDAVKFGGLTETEKAARLIFLNKTCYNGLYRVNSRGLFNVPYGRHNNPSICDEAVLRRIGAYLNNNDITITNTGYEQAVLSADKNSFVYFDPPYHSPGKTNFTEYHAKGFGGDEQERLRDVYIELTQKGIKCLLSNSDTELIRDLYSHKFLDIIPVQAKRCINSNSAGRGSTGELLIKNWQD